VISNPLILYNSSISQSLTDAQTYITTRGLPTNLAGFNFGSVGTFVPNDTNWQDGTVTLTANSYKNNGVTITSYDGQPLGFNFSSPVGFSSCALVNILTTAFYDAILLSTFTPLAYFSTFLDGGTNIPFSALLAYIPGNFASTASLRAYSRYISLRSPTAVFPRVMPHGRIGCPASYTPNSTFPTFDFTVEMVPRVGGTIVSQAVNNAVVAEKTYNFGKPHVTSSLGGAFVSGGFGFTAAYWTSLMAKMRAAVCNWTIDIGNGYAAQNYFGGTTNAADLWNGTLAPAISMWALCGAFNMNGSAGSNTGDQNVPGSHVYSANYTVVAGGWSAHWYSYQWFWTFDFLYNGGSAGFITVTEPASTGNMDPLTVLTFLLGGYSLCEVLMLCSISDGLSDTRSNERLTVVGDPLYRPYATTVQTAVGFQLPGFS